MTGEDRTTPRPWAFAPGDWEFHPHVIGPKGEYVGAGDAEDDHRLIVEAVNQYDRLRAIEEAARNCSGSPEHFGGCGCTCHAALEGAPQDQPMADVHKALRQALFEEDELDMKLRPGDRVGHGPVDLVGQDPLVDRVIERLQALGFSIVPTENRGLTEDK